MRPLSYRQRLFVEYYLGESKGCAVDAARRVGYGTPHPEGVRLLKNPTIRAAIDARVVTAAMAAQGRRIKMRVSGRLGTRL
jgi:phage terminase small subunit